MNKTYTLWYGIEDEESNLCGEEFFVEVVAENIDIAKLLAKEIIDQYFHGETVTCYGKVSSCTAEIMGLDTY